jgi:3-deoxy-D-manno-octulosonic-acid transferase
MHRYLLNLLYATALCVALPWLGYRAITTNKYRRGWLQKIFGWAPRNQHAEKCIWLHAVSVGEVNLLAPVIQRLQASCPDVPLAISTTTRTGFELALKKYPRIQSFYFPFDFSWAIRNAIARVRPRLLVLAELEIWPNLIQQCGRDSIPIGVINGRLSEHSFRGYQRLIRWVRPAFAGLDFVLAQNCEYAERFAALGVAPEKLQIVGSVKFDGANTDRSNSKSAHLAQLAGIQPADQVWLAGSTQAPEEAFAIETFKQLSPRYPQLKLLIVPRHPERFDAVARMLDQSGLTWQRRSQLSDTPTATVEAKKQPNKVLLVDTVGELSAWWGTSQIAFVGGSFGSRGGQNMIEPAAYGAAVSFGPNTKNFRDIVAMLLDRNAAVRVNSQTELYAFVERCLRDHVFAEELGVNAREAVLDQQGSADTTNRLLLEALHKHSGAHISKHERSDGAKQVA